MFEGNRRVRSRVARDIRLRIKRMLGVLEGLEEREKPPGK